MSMHLGVMVLCAACVSVVFAVLQRDAPAAQVKFAAQTFGALVGGGLMLGVLQYIVFR
jgi:hypothetical protein